MNSLASVNQEEDTSDPENYAVLSGDNSARLVVPGSVAVTLVQTFDSTLDRYTAVATQGMEANLSAWVYCTVASRGFPDDRRGCSNQRHTVVRDGNY